MKISNKKIQFLMVLFLVPIFASALSYLVLRNQPKKLWRRLMPSQIFSHPQRDLKLLVLTRTDERNWENLFQSTYFYKEGSWRWVVLKEEMQGGVRSGPANLGISLSVDSEGKFYDFIKGSEKESPKFTEIKEVPESYRSQFQNAFILAEDAETFTKMQKRIPALRSRKLGGTFADSLSREDKDHSQILGTYLKSDFILRFAALIGFVLSLFVFVWIAGEGLATGYRIALTALAFPASGLILLWAFQWGTLLSSSFFGFWPWFLWAASFLAVAFQLFWNLAPLGKIVDREGLTALVKECRKEFFSVGLPAIIVGGYLASLTFTQYLTWGDGSAFTWAGATIYDLGEWSISKLHAMNQFSLKNFITYPPSIAVCFAYLLWAVGPSKNQIFFPGQETGTVCLIYGCLIVLTHLSLVTAVLGFLRARYQCSKTFGAFAVLFILYAIPSSCGTFHASEAFLWPLMACAIVVIALFKETASPVAFLGMILFIVGLPYIKKEAAIQAAFLLLPWVILALRSLYRTSARVFVAAVGLTFSMILPLVIVQWQRNRLGITTPDFAGATPVELFHRIASYGPLFRQALDIFLARGDVYYVTHPIPFLLLAAAIFLVKQVRQFDFRDWLVPSAHLAFLVLFPMMYLFSTWSAVWLHLFQSWGRIVLPVYFSLGWWTAELYFSLMRKPSELTTPAAKSFSLNLSENH